MVNKGPAPDEAANAKKSLDADLLLSGQTTGRDALAAARVMACTALRACKCRPESRIRCFGQNAGKLVVTHSPKCPAHPVVFAAVLEALFGVPDEDYDWRQALNEELSSEKVESSL